eukprot:m.15120 g.15120  ORF g.15120 m.15120 type:complete len:150 (-) comp6514_c0_seq2:855-1304(-)
MFCIAIITRASQRPNNMSEAIEHLRLVVRECFVYKLPPRPSNSGYRADKWGLSNPLWTGRMKITATDSLCTINLLDPKDGSLFAQVESHLHHSSFHHRLFTSNLLVHGGHAHSPDTPAPLSESLHLLGGTTSFTTSPPPAQKNNKTKHE